MFVQPIHLPSWTKFNANFVILFYGNENPIRIRISYDWKACKGFPKWNITSSEFVTTIFRTLKLEIKTVKCSNARVEF